MKKARELSILCDPTSRVALAHLSSQQCLANMQREPTRLGRERRRSGGRRGWLTGVGWFAGEGRCRSSWIVGLNEFFFSSFLFNACAGKKVDGEEDIF
jgi:hypothetical protein